MKVKIEINGDNAAFVDEEGNDNNEEFSRILRLISRTFETGNYPKSGYAEKIRDINGNPCGYIRITD
jgi:hypothetical protein